MGRIRASYRMFSSFQALKIVETARARGSTKEFSSDAFHPGKLRQFYNAFTRSVQNLTAARAFFRRQDFDDSTDISSP